MEFTLNGTKKTYDGDPELSLLKYLREHENITSPKDGCSCQATCGCCTVELNRKAVLACVTPMKKVAGGTVLTIEGLDSYRKQVIADAFVLHGAAQCGFCTPGIVMRAKVLLDENPSPTRDDVVKSLTLHLCRCTGYLKIIEAVLAAAQAIRDKRPIEPGKPSGKIGSRQPKYEARQLVLGEYKYVGDLRVDGLVYGALKFSDHPRAKVLAIDVSKASQMPGVIRVFTAKDIPGERVTGLIVSDWPLMVEIGEETRYVGDVLAGVVATSEEIARKAVKAIEVKYEVLTPITDMHEAAKATAHQIHTKGNVLSDTVVKRGDAERRLKRSPYVVHGVYETPAIEHAFLETECCIAKPGPNGGVELQSQGQGAYEEQKLIARILKLPLDQVRVTQVPTGGGFGGKEDLSVQGHAALYAFHLKRPVRVGLNRDESIRMHPKRHACHMEYTLGCNKKGKLTALKAVIVGDTGAYASVGMKVMERAAGHATSAYMVPAVDIVSKAVYTNNVPAGAMRGFGVPQTAFAMEGCIDELCKLGGFDRWQFRFNNALQEGDPTSTGQVLKAGVGVRATLLAVKDQFKKAKYAGIACGIKNTGIGNGMPDGCKAKIEIQSAQHVIIHHGWTEMGQGVHTIAAQVVCEETGISPDIIEVKVDTTAKAESGMTTSSRATSVLGNALIATCKQLKADLQTKTLGDLVGKVYEGSWVCDWTTKPEAKVDEIITHYSYSFATQVVTLDDTGKIDTIYAAHDAGRILNPTMFEGQIEGAIHMGLGYALSEELVFENGVPKSTKLRDMGILRAKEMPKVVVIGIEVSDPHGPYGAKGVGEIGLVPTAAAVANALCQFDGSRRYKLPIKASK